MPPFSFPFPSGAQGITGTTSNLPSTFYCSSDDSGITGTTFNINSASAFACSNDNPNLRDARTCSDLPSPFQQTQPVGVSSSEGFRFPSVPASGASIFGGIPFSSSSSSSSSSAFGPSSSTALVSGTTFGGIPFSSSSAAAAFGPSSSTSALVSGTKATSIFGGNSNSTSFHAQTTPSFFFYTPTSPEFLSSRTTTNENVAAPKPDFCSITSSTRVTPAFRGPSHPAVKNQCRGSHIAPYSPKQDPTEVDLGHKLASISGMDVYSDKSQEELRLEDYQLRNGGFSVYETKADFTDSLLSYDLPSEHQKTPSPFGFTSSPGFGVSSSEAFSFPSVPTSGASSSGWMPLFSGSPLFGPSASATGSRTTSASVFGGIPVSCAQSTPFRPNMACVSPKPDCFFSTTNVEVTPSFGGFSQPVVINQCKGSRIAPYHRTYSEADGNSMTSMMTSISAMHIYSGKSHEELRLEDYQQRNIDFTPNPFSSDSSIQQPSPRSNLFAPQPPSSPTSDIFMPRPGSSSSNLTTVSTGPSSHVPQDKPGSGDITRTCNQHTTTSQSSPGFITTQPIKPAKVWLSLIMPAFRTHNCPNEAPPSPTSPTSPPTSPTSPAPGSWPSPPSTQFNETKGISSTTPGSVTKGRQSKEKVGDCCVSKGLEILVENLGFNPWAKGGHGKDTDTDTALDFPSEWILPCEDADRDEDIIALAEFAVEQHNALDKDGKKEKVGFVKVVGACLEAVSGGRYHIVLEAYIAHSFGFSGPKRYYAAVLRKLGRLSHLTVLEKWLEA